MDMRLLVQKRDELDAAAAIKFIEGCKDAKLVLVHASLKDDLELVDYITQFIEKTKIPFAGTRVSGFMTLAGHISEGIAITVLSGDFTAEIITEKLNFQEPAETINKILPKIKTPDLCIVYSANFVQKTRYIDHILRALQQKTPKTQFYGCVSAPSPMVFTKDGISDDSIVIIPIANATVRFSIDAGFKLAKGGDEIVITKSDEFRVYEINGKNAVDEYCKIQHMQPYFLNMLAKILTKSDAAQVAWGLAKASTTLYEGILKFALKGFAGKIDDETAEPFAVFELDTERGCIITSNYRPEGTKFVRGEITKETQLAAYDKIREKLKDSDYLLINSCVYTQIYFDFDFKALHKKLKQYKQPYLLSFTFGEIGAFVPYTDNKKNLTHGAVIVSLGLKK